MDLHKVTFPTFVLEPRSMLERITDFMSHPDLIFGCVPVVPRRCARLTPDAVQRRATIPRNASCACCSTTSRGGTSSPRGSRSRTSVPLARVVVLPHRPHVRVLVFAVIILSLESSSAVDMTTPTAPADITSQNKVRLLLSLLHEILHAVVIAHFGYKSSLTC